MKKKPSCLNGLACLAKSRFKFRKEIPIDFCNTDKKYQKKQKNTCNSTQMELSL